jgi:hypothetical protein
VDHSIRSGWGAYVYLLEGSNVAVNGHELPVFGAAQITGAGKIWITAQGDSELLVVAVALKRI